MTFSFLRSSRPDVLCESGVLRNFTKFSGKHLCQSPFFNKVADLTLFKKETLAQVLSCKFCEIFKNTFFIKHHWWLLLFFFSDISVLPLFKFRIFNIREVNFEDSTEIPKEESFLSDTCFFPGSISFGNFFRQVSDVKRSK